MSNFIDFEGTIIIYDRRYFNEIQKKKKKIEGKDVLITFF